MKKTLSSLLVVAFLLTLITVSCKKKKEEPTTPQKTYSELIIGRWKTADGGHYEVYNANGTGKMWDPADDVQEDEADTFDWNIEENTQKMTQIIHYQSGHADLPQYCNIITLNESSFVYNNEGWRAEYNLIRE